MLTGHRLAFPAEKPSQKPIQSSIEKIVNEASLKMKEMIAKKLELQKDTELLRGQNDILNQNLESVKKQIEDKGNTFKTLDNEYSEIVKKTAELEEERKKMTELFNEKEATFKESINKINQDLNSIEYGTMAENSQKKAELKRACEELLALKANTELLREQIYKRNRELYQLEIEDRNTLDDDKINNRKVQSGIELLNELYQLQKRKCNEEEEESERNPPQMIESKIKEETNKDIGADIKEKETS